jgi:hypothetical protein
MKLFVSYPILYHCHPYHCSLICFQLNARARFVAESFLTPVWTLLTISLVYPCLRLYSLIKLLAFSPIP